MKIKGPFDQFGKKLPSETSSVDKKEDASYERLSSADRVKLLEQNYRELKMEEARAKYPLKFLPPMNRNYIEAPTRESLESKKRPRVRVKIPKVANKSLIVSNYIPSWGGSPHSKLSIKLPIDVNLATVLKNIYEHMYQYYIHQDPKKGKVKNGVAARQVIQSLVDKDLRNISKIVQSRNISPYESSLNDKRLEQLELLNSRKITKTFFRKTAPKVLPFRRVIVAQEQLLPKMQVPAKRILQPPLPLPQLVVQNQYRGKLDPLDDRFQLMRVLNSFARLPSQFIDLLDMKHHFPPFGALLLKYKNRLNLPETEVDTAKKSLNGKAQYPPVIQEKVSFLSSIEPYLRVLSYLKMRDMRVLRTDFAKTMMSIPLIAIQKDEKRRQQALAAKRQIKRPTTTKKVLKKTPSRVQVGARRHLLSQRASTKQVEMTKENPVEDISSTNYFLIDTTGVADNKPMVIESVEDYLKKLQANKQKKSDLFTAKKTVQKSPAVLQPSNTYRNSFALKKYNWDKRHHVINPRYRIIKPINPINPTLYHTLVARDNIPNVGGKFFSNEEILLQRHHRLFKSLKLMKRFVNETDTPEKGDNSEGDDDDNDSIKLKSTNSSSDCQLNNRYDMCINETLPNNTRLINAIRSALLSLTTRNLNISLDNDNEVSEDDSRQKTKESYSKKLSGKGASIKNQRSKELSKTLSKSLTKDDSSIFNNGNKDIKSTKKKGKNQVKNHLVKNIFDIDIMNITMNLSSDTNNPIKNTTGELGDDNGALSYASSATNEKETSDATLFSENQVKNSLEKLKLKAEKEDQKNVTQDLSKDLSSNITNYFNKSHTKALTKELSDELSRNITGDLNKNVTKGIKNRTEEFADDMSKDLLKVLMPDTNDTKTKSKTKDDTKSNSNKTKSTKIQNENVSSDQTQDRLENVLVNTDDSRNNQSRKLSENRNKGLAKNSTQDQNNIGSEDLMTNLTNDITQDVLNGNSSDSSKNSSSKINKDRSKTLTEGNSKASSNKDNNKNSSDDLIKDITLDLDKDLTKGINNNSAIKPPSKNIDKDLATKDRKKDISKDLMKDNTNNTKHNNTKTPHKDNDGKSFKNATSTDKSEELPTDSTMESETITTESKDFNYNEISINKDLSENVSEDIMKGFSEKHKSEDFKDVPKDLSKHIVEDITNDNKKNITTDATKDTTKNIPKHISRDKKHDSLVDSKKNSTAYTLYVSEDIAKDFLRNATKNSTTYTTKTDPFKDILDSESKNSTVYTNNKHLSNDRLEPESRNSTVTFNKNNTRYDSKKTTDNIIDSIGHNLYKAKKFLRNLTEEHTTKTIANHLKSIQTVIEATKNKSQSKEKTNNAIKGSHDINKNILDSLSKEQNQESKSTYYANKDLFPKETKETKRKNKGNEDAVIKNSRESFSIEFDDKNHEKKQENKRKQKFVNVKKIKETKKIKTIKKERHEEKKRKKKHKSNNDQLKFQSDLPDDKNELNQGMFNDNDMGTYHSQNENVVDSLTKSLEIDQTKANNLTNLFME